MAAGGSAPPAGASGSGSGSGTGSNSRIEIGMVFHPASHPRLLALAASLPPGSPQPDPSVSRNIPVPPNTQLAKVFRAFARDQHLPSPDDWRMVFLPENAANPAANHIIPSLSLRTGSLAVQQGDRFAIIHRDDATHIPLLPTARPAGSASSSAASPSIASSSDFPGRPAAPLPPRPAPAPRAYTPPSADSNVHTASPVPQRAPPAAAAAESRGPHVQPVPMPTLQAQASALANRSTSSAVPASMSRAGSTLLARAMPHAPAPLQTPAPPAPTPLLASSGSAVTSIIPSATLVSANMRPPPLPTSSTSRQPISVGQAASSQPTAGPSQSQEAASQSSSMFSQQSSEAPSTVPNSAPQPQETAAPSEKVAAEPGTDIAGAEESIDGAEFVPHAADTSVGVEPAPAPSLKTALPHRQGGDAQDESNAAPTDAVEVQQPDGTTTAASDDPTAQPTTSAEASHPREQAIPTVQPESSQLNVQAREDAGTKEADPDKQSDAVTVQPAPAPTSSSATAQIAPETQTAPTSVPTLESSAPVNHVAPSSEPTSTDVEMQEAQKGVEAVEGKGIQGAEGILIAQPATVPAQSSGVGQSGADAQSSAALKDVDTGVGAQQNLTLTVPPPTSGSAPNPASAVAGASADALDQMLDSMFEDGTGQEPWQQALAGLGSSSQAMDTDEAAVQEEGAGNAVMEPAAPEEEDNATASQPPPQSGTAKSGPAPQPEAALQPTTAQPGPASFAAPPTAISAKAAPAPPISTPQTPAQGTSAQQQSQQPTSGSSATGTPGPLMTLGGTGVDLMRSMLAATTQKLTATQQRDRATQPFNFARFKKSTGPVSEGSIAAESEGGAGRQASATASPSKPAEATPQGTAAVSTTEVLAPPPLARDFFADELESATHTNAEPSIAGDLSNSMHSSVAGSLGAEARARQATTASRTGSAQQSPAPGSAQQSPAPGSSAATPSTRTKAGPASKMGGFKARPKSRGGDGSASRKSDGMAEGRSDSVASGAVGSPAPQHHAPEAAAAATNPVDFMASEAERMAELIRVKRERLAEAERDEMLLARGYEADAYEQDEYMREDGPAPPAGSQARLLHNPKDLLPRRAPSRSQSPQGDEQRYKLSPQDTGPGSKHYARPKKRWEGEDEHGRRSRSPIETRKHPPEVRKQMTREQRELNDLIDGPIDRLPEEGPQARPRPKYTHDWSSGSGEDTDEGDSADEATRKRREETLAAKGIGPRPRKRKRKTDPAGPGASLTEAGPSAGAGAGAGAARSRISRSREKSHSVAREHAQVPALATPAPAASTPAAAASTPVASAPAPAPAPVPPPPAKKAGPAKKGKSAWPENPEEAEALAAKQIEDIINRHEYLKLNPADNKRARSGDRKNLYDECPRVPKEFIDWRELYALEPADELDQFIGDLLGGNLWHGDKIADRYHFKGVGSQTKLARMLVLLEVCLQTRATLARQLRNRGKGGGRKNVGVAPGKWPIIFEHVVDKVMKWRKHLELNTRDLDDILAEAVALKRRDMLDGEPDKELEEKLAISSSQIVVEPPKATTLQQPPTPPGGWPPKKKKQASQPAARSGTHDSAAVGRSHSPASTSRVRVPTSKAKAGTESVGQVLNHNAELKRKRQAGRVLPEDDDEDSVDGSEGERPLARMKTASGSATAASKKGKAAERPSSSPAHGFDVQLPRAAASSSKTSLQRVSAAVLQQFEDVLDDKLEGAFSRLFEEHFSTAFGKTWKPAHEMGFNEMFPSKAREYWSSRHKELAASLRRQMRTEIEGVVEQSLQGLVQTQLEEQQVKFEQQLEAAREELHAQFSGTLTSTLAAFQEAAERKQLAREKVHRRTMKEEMLIELGKELRAQLRSANAGNGNSGPSNGTDGSNVVNGSSSSPSVSATVTAGGTQEENTEGTEAQQSVQAREEEDAAADPSPATVAATSAAPPKAPYKRRKIKKSAPSGATRKGPTAAADSAGANGGEGEEGLVSTPGKPAAVNERGNGTNGSHEAGDEDSVSAASFSNGIQRSSAPIRSPGGNSSSQLEILLPLRPRPMHERVVQQSSEDESEMDSTSVSHGRGGAARRRRSGAAGPPSSSSSDAASTSHRLRSAVTTLVNAMGDIDEDSSMAVDLAVDHAFGGIGGQAEDEEDQEMGEEQGDREHEDQEEMGEEEDSREGRAASENY